MMEFLQSAGPYSAPINIVLMAGLTWLARDRQRILQALAATQTALAAEKDRRADDMDRNYREFMTRGDAMTQAMADFTTAARALLQRGP